MTPPRHWSHSLASASKRSFRRRRRDSRLELWEGNWWTRFTAKNRAKLGRRDERRAFGAEDTKVGFEPTET